MTLNSDAKFKEKLICGSKHDIRNLVDFHSTTQKPENFIPMGYFCPKFMSFELKNTEELSFMALNSDAKFEQTLTLWFQKWHGELSGLSLEHLEV